MDLGVNDLGREQVLLYVKKYVPDQLASVDSAFQLLKTEEANWPTRLNQDKLQQAFILLQKFINYITTNQSNLISSSSKEKWENIAQSVHVMKQWLLANMKDIPPSLSGKKLKRQEYMAQNAIYLIDKVKPNAKFIFWAYNGHLSKSDTTWRNIGYYLNERLGEKYYALGLECYQGTFQSRVLQPDSFWGELKPDTIAAIEKSITWYFAQTRKGNLYVDYRMAQSDPIVNKWLETPQKIGMGFWINRGSKANQDSLKLKGNFDGTLFIERSTPSHPTKNAVERSLKKVGL